MLDHPPDPVKTVDVVEQHFVVRNAHRGPLRCGVVKRRRSVLTRATGPQTSLPRLRADDAVSRLQHPGAALRAHAEPLLDDARSSPSTSAIGALRHRVPVSAPRRQRRQVRLDAGVVSRAFVIATGVAGDGHGDFTGDRQRGRRAPDRAGQRPSSVRLAPVPACARSRVRDMFGSASEHRCQSRAGGGGRGVGAGEAPDGVPLVFVVAAAAPSFTMSASAGCGGILILVPALALVLGVVSDAAVDGRRDINRRVGEVGYTALLWTEMAGYIAHLVVTGLSSAVPLS